MINLRYHIVSLAAVFIALAAGIGIGAGYLNKADDPVVEADGTGAVQISPALAGFDAAYATLTEKSLIDGKLDKESVVVLTTPNAREAEVESIRKNLQAAGAKVVGTVELTDKILDPANRQFAEGVAAQGASDAGDQEGYGLVGQAMATAFFGEAGGEIGQQARTIRAAFVEGGLIEPVVDADEQATAAVVVAGPASATSAGEGTVIANLAPSLDQASNGVIVAGPVTSGDDDGVVGQVRASEANETISTIDVTDSGTGQVATVLALVQQIADNPGSWGTSRGESGAVPQ